MQNPTTYERYLHKPFGQTVGEVMNQNPITTTADKPLKEAAKAMSDRNVHLLPVLDGVGKVVGILTRGDIIRAMAGSQE